MARRDRSYPSGGEFQVNSFIENFQDRASVAATTVGDFVVAWESFLVDGVGFGIAAQRFAANGDRLGEEFVVNSYANSAQRYPAAAANDETSQFLIAWRSDARPEGPNTQAFVSQLYDADGTPVGGESELATFGGNAGLNVDVAARDAGFVAVGERLEEGYTDVIARRIDGSGMPAGEAFLVNTFTNSIQSTPSVAGQPGHGFVVVWQSLNQDGSNLGIFGQRFDDDATPLGDEFQVNTATQGQQAEADVAMDGAGRFVATWVSATGGLDAGISVQRFDSNGTRLGTEFKANSGPDNGGGYPAVAADPEGGFLVAWQSFGLEGPPTETGIFAQQFDSGGMAVGTEFQVNTYTPKSQSFPDVAVDGQGRYAVVWTSSGQDGDEGAAGGIFGQRFAPAP